MQSTVLYEQMLRDERRRCSAMQEEFSIMHKRALAAEERVAELEKELRKRDRKK